MGYKTILAVLDSTKSARQISDFSIALAEQFGSHVIGLHSEAVAAMPLIAPMEIPDPVAVQAMQDMAHEETRTIGQVFEEAGRREGVSTEWRSFLSSSGYGQAFTDSTRSVDLIVAAQGEQGAASENRSELETVLYESGRPVLLVPYIFKEPKPIKRVLIAWNGSREAARATFDALPFLKQATSVEIFSVVDSEAADASKALPGGEIAAALARHGVNVTVVTKELAELRASAHIENRLSDESIDLLVMGAYSHKRWWEVLFGGVTRTVLDSMTALTLLSR
ncbi:universal stress protein [Rhizobium paknamense]|uniref:Nucleotide-binding universal stress UspA family protein n=1 Tax=Rhizobium paknamense TaxID=1206817 RepID=A0ABU0ICD7_9HYPH|nr:universal stress protein [Rhizobium paknamense]MDQ0455907.1 nucleotide-binding universal stress UspA family protein [Rhizobium paknamense]